MGIADEIFVEREGAVARLVLNRPDKRNALTMAMWRAIPPLLEPLSRDPQVRVLIVTGAGGHFASGVDVAEFATEFATRDQAVASQGDLVAAMAALEDFPLPTLAQIEGACVGAGCGLALCCDLRFAAAQARLGITPAKLGLAYGLADTRRLLQAVGPSAAKDILFTGRILTAAEAHAVRLVDRVIDGFALEAEVMAYVGELLKGSTATAKTAKAMLRMLRDGAVMETDASRALFAAAFETKDFQEGRAAFLEKRPPKFG